MADSKISALTALTSLAGTDEMVVASSGTTKRVTFTTLKSQVGLFNAYALLRDEKAANTDGGGFTSGAWRTRDLNTESFDPSGIVSIASNQFTLQAGTYWICARAPAYYTTQHKTRIQDITNTATLLVGSSCYMAGPGGDCQTDSVVQGRFTLAGATVLELQHQCTATKATNGLGVASNFGVVEVYSEVAINREAS